jgi:hypothetical protein
MFTRRCAHPYGAAPIGTTDQHNLLIPAVLGTRPHVAHAVSRQGRARRGRVQPHETRDVRARATPTNHLNGSWVAIQLDDCGLAASASFVPCVGRRVPRGRGRCCPRFGNLGPAVVRDHARGDERLRALSDDPSRHLVAGAANAPISDLALKSTSTRCARPLYKPDACMKCRKTARASSSCIRCSLEPVANTHPCHSSNSSGSTSTCLPVISSICRQRSARHPSTRRE